MTKQTWAVFAVALAVRLIYVGIGGRSSAERAGDALDYHEYASALLDHGVYVNTEGRRATRTPGYPLLLAAQYMTLGRAPVATQIWQSALGAASCVLVFLLAAHWAPPPWPLAAGFAAAFSWDMIEPCARLLTEASAAFFLLLTLWMLLKRPSVARGAGAGAAAATAYWLRPEFLPWTALMSLEVSRRNRRAVAAAFLAAPLFAAALWAGHSWRALGRPTLTMTDASFNLYGWGIPRTIEERLGGARWVRLDDRMPEMARSDAFARLSKDYWRAAPLSRLLEAGALNVLILYYPMTPGFDPTFVFIAPFAALGFILALRNTEMRPLAVTVAYLTAVYAVAGVMIPRHRQTFAGITIVLAAVAAADLRRRYPTKLLALAAGGWAVTCIAAWAATPLLRDAAHSFRDRAFS